MSFLRLRQRAKLVSERLAGQCRRIGSMFGSWLEALGGRGRRLEPEGLARRAEGAQAGGSGEMTLGGLSVGITIVTAALLIRNVYALDQAQRAHLDAVRAFTLTGRFVNSLLAAETGHRGYLLTDREESLEPYHRSAAAMPELRQQALELAARYPEARSSFDRLVQLAGEKMADVRAAIETRHSSSRGRAVARVMSGPGRMLTAEIRSVATHLQEFWRRRMARHSADLERANLFILVTAVAGGVAHLAACGAALIGMRQRVSRTGALLARLRESEHKHQLLARRVEGAAEEERARLARAVHDDIGQALTAVELELAAMRLSGVLGGREEERLDRLRGLIRGAKEAVRSTAVALRPMMLERLGLQDALEWQLQAIRRQTGLTTALVCRFEGRLSRAVETALFRIVQEALSNTVRHAGGRSVTVELRPVEHGLLCTIRDDGKGFDVEQVLADYSSVGLFGMRERAHSIGARLDWCSVPGEGTEVRVFVPAGQLGSEVRI